MKSVVVLCGLLCFVQCKVLPNYVAKLTCPKSVPDMGKCLTKNLQRAIPILIKGIPELNMPPIDPFEIPVVTVDRTLSDGAKIKATVKNVRMVGAGNVLIEDVKGDPVTLAGELRAHFPQVQVTMDYYVSADFLNLYEMKGHFKGNFSDIQMSLKGTLKTKSNNGVKYFAVDELFLKLNVGDARIEAVAEEPEMQYETDLMINIFNENMKDILNFANPIFGEMATQALKPYMNQMLATVPAKELLPE